MNNVKLELGNYVYFGKYYNEPILWKYVKKDENGYLLLSEYIICLKPFDSAKSGNIRISKNYVDKYGSNKWENSNIREWLNSDNKTVNYSTQPPTKESVWYGYNAYDSEPGFLTNFSSTDKNNINVFKHEGVNDQVFFLSKDELENIYKDDKSRIKCLTKSAVENSNYRRKWIIENSKYWYWVNIPYPVDSYSVCCVNYDGSFCWSFAYYGDVGVVPALYLKSDICKSGKGTKSDPFVI